MALRIGQESKYQGSEYWRWSVWIDGPDEELKNVEQVVYTLHPSFPDPIQVVSDRRSRFRLETAGWGEFRLYASVVYQDGTTLELQHDLHLSYPEGEAPWESKPEPEPTSPGEEPPVPPPPDYLEADAVFEGGEASIAAFAGALAAAEESAGITRWVNVVGSSGGAIVATLLAVGYTPREVKEILLATDYRRFLDVRWGGLGAVWRLGRHGGFAEGKYLRKWLEDLFEQKLGKRSPTFADVVHPDRSAELSPSGRYRLRLVASDITGGRMIVLPDDIEDYEDAGGRSVSRDDFPLVDAVRMSMSLPFVFTPVVVYRSGRPYCIVDGRLLSTFPIWLLDSATPARPTWGFHAHGGSGPERLPYRSLSRTTFSVLGVAQAMVSSVVEAWDARYTSGDTVARTVSIETGDLGSRRFNLSKRDVESLYAFGYDATREFFSLPRDYFNSFGVAPVDPTFTAAAG